MWTRTVSLLVAAIAGPALLIGVDGASGAAASEAVAAPARPLGPESCPSVNDVSERRGPSNARADLHYLTDVRAGVHPCFDRIVFEVRPADHTADALGYQLTYEDGTIRQDGSGRRVHVDGDEHLVVRLTPARDVKLAGGGPERTYDGPSSLRPAGSHRVEEVRHAGSFEGVVTWVVGLDEKRPFSVDVLEEPRRLVIDIW